MGRRGMVWLGAVWENEQGEGVGRRKCCGGSNREEVWNENMVRFNITSKEALEVQNYIVN